MKKTLLAAIMAVLTLGAFTGCSDDDKDDLKTVDKTFTEELNKLFPAAQNVKWEKKYEWTVAEFTSLGQDVDVWFNSDASWAMTQTEYATAVEALPEAVRATFYGSEFSTWKIDDIDLYNRPDADFFVIEVESHNQPDVDVLISTSGEMMGTMTARQSDILPNTALNLQ